MSGVRVKAGVGCQVSGVWVWKLALVLFLLAPGTWNPEPAFAKGGSVSVRVVKWDEPRGELVLFLPMHSLELECIALTRPREVSGAGGHGSGKKKKPKPNTRNLIPGSYYRGQLREKNTIEVQRRIFRIERMVLK